MNIRSKIILITLPLILAPLILTVVVSTLSAKNGITGVATELLAFKTEVLTNYMDSQWTLLLSNDLDRDEQFLEITKLAIEDYSRTLIGDKGETIFALTPDGIPVMGTSEISFSVKEQEELSRMLQNQISGWNPLTINGSDMIAEISYFKPFDWYVFVSVERESFYGEISNIYLRTLVIGIISLVFSVLMLVLFSSYLTQPLENIVGVMKNIIMTNDLSMKVSLKYKDETGRLGHFFNIMTGELEESQKQVKKFALQAVVAQRKESKIRNIFQKYVPKDVIDKFYTDPESMLVGENRILAVLFSDIRSFTTISEGLEPDVLVDSLNKYFGYMVDVISDRRGIVDKYIGDAIMAFFGAPVQHDDDALQSVLAALDMIDKLIEFNLWQKKNGRVEFHIGVGINYGTVTIGNIGSEKKMDYTVIGDMVNLASRMEGLTKLYKEPILISEALYREVSEHIPCRMVDRVIVKGKTQSTSIYSVRRKLTPEMDEAWKSHEKGIEEYYLRNFVVAESYFRKANDLLPDDYCSRLFIERCVKYIQSPPDINWTGDTVLNRK